MTAPDKKHIYQLQEFNHFCDSLPQIVVCVDPGGRILFTNNRCERLFGSSLNKKEQAEKLMAIIHPSCRPNFEKVLKQCFEKRTSQSNVEIRVKHDDHRYKWHIFDSVPVRDTEGELEMWYWRFFNIDSKMRQIFELKRNLESRDSFFSITAHELRSPLSTASMAVELALLALYQDAPHKSREDLCEYVKKRLDTTLTALRSLNFIVNELTDASKSLRSSFGLTIKEMDLSQTLAKALEKIAPEFHAKHARLKVERPPSLLGCWDEFRIEQIISNLLSNALKYGEGRPVKVRLTDDQNNDRAVLRVEDQGIGIPAQDQDKVFEKFQRSTTQSQSQSMGLGLYITRSLVKAHKGEIWLNSAPGEGSTFVVALPKRRRRRRAK